MTPERFAAVNALFDWALELPPQSRQSGVLRRAAGDAELAAEVLALLAAHDSAEGFLAQPVAHLSPQTRPSRLSTAILQAKSLGPGTVVGDFEVVRLLGSGSFANVYLAHQRSLGRYVALKVAANLGVEAKTMASLEHESIVPVFSETVDAARNLRMICMPFVDGPTLSELIKALAAVAPAQRSGGKILALIDLHGAGGSGGGPAAVTRDREQLQAMNFEAAALWIGARLAEALAFAHAQSVLHLDVKPANILLNRLGRPLLADFNVSRTTQELAGKSRADLGGTPQYMSPEHEAMFRGLLPQENPTSGGFPVDGRSDLYSLAIVLTELLTCQKVVATIDPGSKTTRLAPTDDLPIEIASVLHVAVKVEPHERFADGFDFAQALDNCRDLARIHRTLKALARPVRLARLADKYPAMAIVVLAVVPQMLGSVVNITYNTVRISQELTPAQRATFLEAVLPYNLVVYPLGVWVVWRQIAFVMRSLRIRQDRTAPAPESMAKLRQRVLATPYAVLMASTIGWLPGSYLFAAIIDWRSGPLPLTVYLHFALSFMSSWLIALTYSFLLLEAVTLLLIYPRFWTGCCNVRASASFELRKVNRRLRVFQALAGAIPLAGAVMIVGAGPDVTNPSGYFAFQVMVVGLISLGMCGFVFAIRASERIRDAVDAFTGQGS